MELIIYIENDFYDLFNKFHSNISSDEFVRLGVQINRFGTQKRMITITAPEEEMIRDYISYLESEPIPFSFQ